MKYISLLLLIGSFMNLSAQDSPALKTRIDWFVGEYEGYINGSISGDTASGYWSSKLKTLTITPSEHGENFVQISGIAEIALPHYRIYDDSVLIHYSAPIVNNPDSVFHTFFGTANYIYYEGVAKLFSDSTFEFWYYVPPADGNYWGYFKGKKTKSYAGISGNYENNNDIAIFPNPATNIVRFTLNNKQLLGGVINIINTNGKSVASFNADKKRLSADLSRLPKGYYLVKITYSNKTITKKLLLK